MLNLVGEKKRGKRLFWMVQLMRRLYRRFFYYCDCSMEKEVGALYRLNKIEAFNWAVGLGWRVDEVLYVTGVAKTTFYRWSRRWEAEGFEDLLNKSRCPPKVACRPVRTYKTVSLIEGLRTQVSWGKGGLSAHLWSHWDLRVSASSVGRLLSSLSAEGRFYGGAAGQWSWRRRKKWLRAWAQRRWHKPVVTEPGHYQMDTMKVSLPGGVWLVLFVARDVLTNLTFALVVSRATAAAALRALRYLYERAPEAVKSIQVDGGSEFKGQFEEPCRKDNIPLFVIRPDRPDTTARWKTPTA